MKLIKRLLMFILIMLALAVPSSNVMARELAEGKVVFGGIYRLESGETLNGDLVIFGAVATLEENSTVTGTVVLFGANLEASGKIEKDIVGIGGLITLDETASVNGDVITLGAHLDKSKGALVLGDVMDVSKAPFSFAVPGEINIPKEYPNLFPEVNYIWTTLKILLWSALAILVVLFVPKASNRVAQAFIKQPLIAVGLGLLTIVLAIPLAALFIITLILSPLGLFILLLLGLSWAFGLISIGLEIGKRFAVLVKRDWADPVSAGLGTLFLMLVLNGANEMIPCIGWMLPAVVGMIGLGAVLMTRFGTQFYPYVPESYLPTPPAAPLAPDLPRPPEAQDEESIHQKEKAGDEENS